MLEFKRVVSIGLGSMEPFEYPFKKNCTIVEGRNDSNSGQRSNGSGKSTFIDVVPIALLGISLMKQKIKKVVKWHAPYFEVQLWAENKALKEEYYIKRKIYSNTKPSELVLTVNGVRPVEIPTKKGVPGGVDVSEGNKYIMEKIVGLSLEDCLHYYFISSGGKGEKKYTPFFDMTGQKKLELVSDLSSETKIIDKAIELEKEKISKLSDKSVEIDHKINKIEGSKLGVKHQIDELEAVDRKKVKEDHLEKIKGYDEKIKESQDEIDILKRSIKDTNKLIKDIPQRKKEVSNSITEKKRELKDHSNSLKKEKKKLEKARKREEMDEVNQRIYDNMNEYTSTSESISEVEGIIITLKARAEHIATCPNCDHEFVFQEVEMTPEQVLDELEESMDLKDELKKELEDLRAGGIRMSQEKMNILNSCKENEAKISTLIGNLEAEENILKNELQELEGKLEDLELDAQSHKDHIARNEDQIGLKEEKITNLKEEKTRLENTEDSSKEIIQRMKDDIAKYDEQVVELKKEFDKLGKESLKHGQWIKYYEDFKFYVINKRIKAITGQINYNLKQMASDLSVEIEGFRKLTSGADRQELNPQIYRNGTDPQDYHDFSGGEKARLNAAADFTFQDIKNTNSPTGGINYYSNDEKMSAIDDLGISLLAKSLNSLEKSIFLVSHSGSDNTYENTVTVVKSEDGVSRIDDGERYYYAHHESGSIWSSPLDFQHQVNDGLVEPVSKEKVLELSKEFEEEIIHVIA